MIDRPAQCLGGEHDRRFTHDSRVEACVSALSESGSLENALSVLTLAASSRLPDGELERERLALLEGTLSAARAASAALQMWAAQCLSEYRGSRTTWDVHATSELLGSTLAQFETSARDTALRLAVLMPEVGLDQRWADQFSIAVDGSAAS